MKITSGKTRKHSMRITSGKFRGRKLVSPNSETTHPMGDREKLALFNSLGDATDGATVLDLFAGSGALGLEALSRGASSVDFVENSHKAVVAIKDNIHALKVAGQTKIFAQDVKAFLAYALTSDKKYDLILVDPPYDLFDKYFKQVSDASTNPGSSSDPSSSPSFSSTCSCISHLSELLSPGGKLVLSHPGIVPPTYLFPGLESVSSRKYARANISIYERAK